MAPKAASAADVNVAKLFGALRRRWRIIAVCAVIATALALGLSLIQKPQYTATALILVDWRKDDLTSDRPADSGGVTPEMMDSEIEIARSRTLLGRVVDRLQQAGYAGAQPVRRATILDKIRGKRSEPNAAERREKAVDDLEESLKIKRRRQSYVIEINAAGDDPQKAALVANTVADLYLQSRFEARVEDATRADTWISGRLATLKDQLSLQERAVEDYRSANGLIASDGQMLTDQQATGLQEELVTARADLAEKAARYRQVEGVLQRGGAAQTVAAVVNDPALASLRQQEAELMRTLAQLELRFGDKYPSVKESRSELANVRSQIDRETQRIVASMRNDVGAASARVAALSADATGVRNEIQANNRTGVRLRELEREASATRAVYEGLLKRANEITDQETLKTSEVRLIAKAQPPRQPVSPVPTRAALLGLLVGLAAGVAIAAALELLDGALTGSAEEVEALLSYNMLAAIPRVRSRQLGGLSPFETNPPGFMIAEPASPYAEALQALRSALEFSWRSAPLKGTVSYGVEQRRATLQVIEGERELRLTRQQDALNFDDRARVAAPAGGKVIAVTAATAGDGVTTTAMALTRAFALAGRRAVLIECDFHRQDLSQHLKKPPSMGLVHVLMGAVTWRAALVQDHATSAAFLAAKAPSPRTDGAYMAVEDIFSSRIMTNLLEDLRKHFDVVILDCPPVMDAPEARVLGGIADTALFLVRWGKSPKAATQAAIKRLLAGGAVIAGFALNGAEIDWAQAYYDLPKRLGFREPTKPAPAAAQDPDAPVTEANWNGLIAVMPERDN